MQFEQLNEIPPWVKSALTLLAGGVGTKLLGKILESRRLEKKEYRDTLLGRIRELDAKMDTMQESHTTLSVANERLRGDVEDCERVREELRKLMLMHSSVSRRLGVLRDPLSLCERLNLSPTQAQAALMQRLAGEYKVVHVRGEESYEPQRAVAMAALWSLLKNAESEVLVLAATRPIAGQFMDYLGHVTQRLHGDLSAVTDFPHWDVLRVHGKHHWRLRICQNLPLLVEQKAPNALMSVVLHARREDLAFEDSLEALERCATHPRHSQIVVW